MKLHFQALNMTKKLMVLFNKALTEIFLKIFFLHAHEGPSFLTHMHYLLPQLQPKSRYCDNCKETSAVSRCKSNCYQSIAVTSEIETRRNIFCLIIYKTFAFIWNYQML